MDKKLRMFFFFFFVLSSLICRFSSALCPAQCKCDEDNGESSAAASCIDANLTVIPIFLNPGIRRLDVRDNRIHKLEGALSVYENLEELDLSGNRFQHLGRRQFSQQRRLQQLDVSRNLVTSLHESSFAGPESLQTLDLSHNALSELKNDTFRGLDSLLELRLDRNKLSEMQPAAFRGLVRLRVLHLEGNKLATLAAEWTWPMENLRFLYASENEVSHLPADAFKSLTALRVVSLRDNRLDDSLDSESFRGSRAVDTIDLGHNLFSAVPNGALSHLSHLANLDVSGNPIIDLDRNAFKNLNLLQVLKVGNTSALISVDGQAFKDNVKLRELHLEGCENLQPLPWGVFAANSMLEVVSFRGNGWSTLSPLQLPQTSLKTLRLEGLPLHCNCSLIWLWEVYKSNTSSQSLSLDSVNCRTVSAEPLPENREMGGRPGDPLSKMTAEQLVCSDWSSMLLLVLSLSVLGIVLVLVLTAVIVYKCRRYRMRRRRHHTYSGGSSCLQIKDDTMIYKASLTTYSPGMAVYKTVSTGGYSPTTTEPLYEVPQLGKSSLLLGTNSSSGSSKYSSSGGLVSKQRSWEEEEEDDFCYKPRMTSTLHMLQQHNGSPHSTSTALSSNASSSSSDSTRPPTFYSPRGGSGSSRGHMLLPLNCSPYRQQQQQQQQQQHHSPPSPAPGGGSHNYNQNSSKTLMLQQFSSSSSPSSSPRRKNNGSLKARTNLYV